MNDEKDEKDLSNFDKNVMSFFDICKEVLKLEDKRKLKLSDRKNPFLSRLEKYEKTYSKTEPEEHVGYFQNIYTKNKRFILLGPQRDSWLIDNDISISYGEEINLKTDSKVHLTVIYKTSCKIRDEIRDELEGLPNSADTSETFLPNKLILSLYRIFVEICESENEKTKLQKHVEDLESQAGIKTKKDDSFSGMFDMASNFAEQLTGKKLPKDQMPGQQDISKMMGNLINDPKTKSMIGNVMQQFQNTENIGEMATKLVGALGNGKGLGDILSGMSSDSTSTPTSSTSSIPSITEGTEGTVGDVNDEFNDF